MVLVVLLLVILPSTVETRKIIHHCGDRVYFKDYVTTNVLTHLAMSYLYSCTAGLASTARRSHSLSPGSIVPTYVLTTQPPAPTFGLFASLGHHT